tara:strand:- start:107 stop:331 length:225 start_codon:yes stop_codon:yes gene_type:complete
MKKIPKLSVITPTYKTSFQILSKVQNRNSSLNFLGKVARTQGVTHGNHLFSVVRLLWNLTEPEPVNWERIFSLD